MKEWYLINDASRPNMTGGYESDAFLDYKDDAFAESLESELAVTVELCNCDLSQRKKIRCIVQDNTADTYLKSIERTVLFSRGAVKAGMYIFFEGRYWLITGYPGNNKIYEKATMVLCQYQLRWQNTDGMIVKRWCNITSASKYDVGEAGNQTLLLTSNNYTILTAGDDETLSLDQKRVFIDRRNVKPTRVFTITRTDDVLYDYGNEHGSVLSFIADKDELNLAVDNQELRLCDYIPPATDNIKKTLSPTVVRIEGNPRLRYGYHKKYIAKFYDKGGEELSCTGYSWNVVTDCDISFADSGDSITFYADKEDYIGKSILLQLMDENSVLQEITIYIVEDL